MYIRTERKVEHGRMDLVTKLVRELKKRPESTAPKRPKGREPVIIEQQMRFSDRRQVHVIWSLWKGVPEEARGEVIIDAYEKAFGKDVASQLSLALGVTPEEAEELGMI